VTYPCSDLILVLSPGAGCITGRDEYKACESVTVSCCWVAVMMGAVSAPGTRKWKPKTKMMLQRKLAAEQAQQAQAAAQQPEGSGASAAQRGQLPGFNPAASLQNGQVCVPAKASRQAGRLLAWQRHDQFRASPGGHATCESMPMRHRSHIYGRTGSISFQYRVMHVVPPCVQCARCRVTVPRATQTNLLCGMCRSCRKCWRPSPRVSSRRAPQEAQRRLQPRLQARQRRCQPQQPSGRCVHALLQV